MVVVLAALAVVVGLVTWRVRADGPPPPVAPSDDAVRAAIAADPDGAEAAGQHLLDTRSPRECLPADSPELGPLVGVGRWTTICVSGTLDGSFRQARSDWVPGTVAVSFGDQPPFEPDVCRRRISGRWWEWYPSAVNPVQSCADGWTFQGA
jgi:hypothetical protein